MTPLFWCETKNEYDVGDDHRGQDFDVVDLQLSKNELYLWTIHSETYIGMMVRSVIDGYSVRHM